ncbi:MAG TPA: menaquinone biosynthesis protein [Blastocatellia bacterium]|nr:menaquinone biosynthesis protein [Blastocatellia bacterium]HMV81523.1 menaquinone biosynthesis protein [Blastocatellia bacterium]HMX27545.1 menaquinone biosynthesis protein [Blastocatellia bacterium]HMY72299.1 menaquinone biosynthesis protein [Blastocatellia bacterium]HNG28546.1 menaquinone biosynthesis protein [Blastocatellia bacterium]
MRIAASTYLNSAPLVHSFVQGTLRHHYEFLGNAAPSKCAAMLAAGQCEIALIPVIEYQRIPGLRLIPEIAVASKQQVRSVLLAARRPLEEAREVTLDTSSRTSQALVRILFAHRYKLQPVFRERTPDANVECENMLEGGDAALVIGDPAMRLSASAQRLGVRIYDLAEEWRTMTGLPFVFAVWAVREDACQDSPALVRDFLEAKREGQSKLEEIAAQYVSDLELPQEDLLGYLRDNVNYDLDTENIAGMRRYFDLAYELGVIPEVRELHFLRQGNYREATAK